MGEVAALRPQSVAGAVEIDREAVFKALGLNPRDPLAQAVALISQRYGLDPTLGHVSIYKGKVYIHLAAYVHLANQQPAYDGYETVREWEDERWYYCEVRVHRSDRRYPATRRGKSLKRKPLKDGKGTYEDVDADAKAFAQALRRALRMAFNVEWPEPEEYPAEAEEVPPPGPVTEVARVVEATEAGVDPQTGEVLDGHGWPPEQDAPGPQGAAPPPAGPGATDPTDAQIDGLRSVEEAKALVRGATEAFRDRLQDAMQARYGVSAAQFWKDPDRTVAAWRQVLTDAARQSGETGPSEASPAPSAAAAATVHPSGGGSSATPGTDRAPRAAAADRRSGTGASSPTPVPEQTTLEDGEAGG